MDPKETEHPEDRRRIDNMVSEGGPVTPEECIPVTRPQEPKQQDQFLQLPKPPLPK